MDFPTVESDIMALAQKMLDGYFWHSADFPNINRINLVNKQADCLKARKQLVYYHSKLRIATKATNEKLSELVQIMKNCLQKSEVDVAANPEKLKQIGWGPRTEPQPAQLPTQPTNLQITAKDNQTINMQWDRPEDDQRIRNYAIEQRTGNSNWKLFQISYTPEATLRNQPLGIQLEYRVRAANNAGTGPFSNTVSVVL